MDMKKLLLTVMILAMMVPVLPAMAQRVPDMVVSAPQDPEVITDSTKYVLMSIPDSLASDVRQLLRGNRKVVRDESKVDLDEKVLYKGDTIPMVLKSLKIGRQDRGLFNFLFIPKGMWSIGLTASYGKFSTSDLELFDVLTDVDLSVRAFSVKPYVSYAFTNNMTAGLRLQYSNMVGGVNNLNLDID